MSYQSVLFYVFIVLSLPIFYLVPQKYRYIVLLISSGVFYLTQGWIGALLLSFVVIMTYASALLLKHFSGDVGRKRGIFVCSVLVLIFTWFLGRGGTGFGIRTIGVSFFTLQVIAYLADVYKGKVEPQKNLAKYALFVSFFPQIIQGPIPRYEKLSKELFEEKPFDEIKFVKGFYRILLGFFLKMMIADKGAIVVDSVFADSTNYAGITVLVVFVLYSLVLYTDFLACTTISRGVANLYQIEIGINFERPYFAESIQDFWRRWHISLSEWLRDYVYIPLGGNRKGLLRKRGNLLITFLVSGFWHGMGWNYMVWGALHGLFQVGESLKPRKENGGFIWGRRLKTFLLVTFAWIFFRAESCQQALSMIGSVFLRKGWNAEAVDVLFHCGLGKKEWLILAISMLVLFVVECLQEKGVCLIKHLQKYFLFRLLFGVLLIMVIMLFGTYGYGFDAKDFIYGGF